MTSETEPVAILRDYTIRYGSFTAVDRASFRLPPGACGLLGKNGAGKSSILKAVLGLIRPAGGEARILGLDAWRQGRQLRERTGYMPEKETTFPGLTGLDSVVLAGRLSGLPRLDAVQRAHEVLFLVGVREARYRQVATFSAGMRQRVKLACALVHDPDLLFLDEPTNGLDPEGRREVLGLLRNIVEKQGKSLILSSHILSDVEELCEYIVLIDGGTVLAEGPVEELTRQDRKVYRVRCHGTEDEQSAFAGRLESEGVLDGHVGDGEYRIALPAARGPESLFEVARKCGLEVRYLKAERKTLAEVFLTTVRNEARDATEVAS